MIRTLFRLTFRTLLIAFIFAGLLLGGVVGLGIWILGDFPSSQTIRGCFKTRMYSVDLCPGSTSYVSLGNISPLMQASVVLSEDASFWQHSGFDFYEIQKSFEKNLDTKKLSRGGSTITQQLAKNLFLTKEKSFARKFKEAAITVQIEKTLSKKEILERYLNVVEFGDNVFGIKKASQFYFSKKPADLTLMESCFLTALLPNPKVYSRSFTKKTLSPFMVSRLRQLFALMEKTKKVESSQVEQAWVEAKRVFPLTPSENFSTDLSGELESSDADSEQSVDKSENSDPDSPVTDGNE